LTFESPCCCPNGCQNVIKKLGPCTAQLSDGRLIDLSQYIMSINTLKMFLLFIFNFKLLWIVQIIQEYLFKEITRINTTLVRHSSVGIQIQGLVLNWKILKLFSCPNYFIRFAKRHQMDDIRMF
jgi:hypothetical protein